MIVGVGEGTTAGTDLYVSVPDVRIPESRYEIPVPRVPKLPIPTRLFPIPSLPFCAALEYVFDAFDTSQPNPSFACEAHVGHTVPMSRILSPMVDAPVAKNVEPIFM
jgi:hypothetical protein